MPGKTVDLADRVVILREQRWRIIFSAVDYTRLKRTEQLIESHRDAVAAHRVHCFDEQRVAHHSDLLALQILWLGHWLVRINVACACVHPTQHDQPRLWARSDLLQQTLTDRTVDHLAHVRFVAEDERQVKDVQLIHHWSHRAD